MGRKKIIGGTSHAAEAFELKPFCYYCDREFDTVKTLIQHQRTKHLACSECGLKFDTVTGLRVHMLNAYKKTMKEVPGAIPGRANPDIVVHGMEGVPKSIVEEKTKQANAERAEKEKARVDKEPAERPAAPPEPVASPVAPDELRGRASSPPRPPVEELTAPSQSSTKPAKAKKVEALVPAPLVPEASVPLVPASVMTPGVTHQLPPLQPQAPPSQGMMSGLSAAVQKLLAGVPGPPDDNEMVVVPALPGRPVPAKLSGLHPVALQVLAVAGVLPSVGAAGMPQAFGEKRPAPVNDLLQGGLLLPPPGSFPALGFPAPGFGLLGGSLPPALGGNMGALGSQIAGGALVFDGKRPRLESQPLIMPLAQ